MYEPLLQVAVPDHHVGSFRRPARSPEGQTRKVVLIAQAWNYPIAERNAAQIAGYLLQSGKVGLLALGDYGKNSQISLPPPIKSSLEDLQKRARQAEDDLAQRKIAIADYINATGLNPGVPMVGVNNETLLMSTNDCEAAVLISGGFHPQGVAQELAKNEQAVCSIIAPELYDKPKEEHTLDPQKMREEARHGRFSIHLLGGIRSEAAKLAKKNIGDGDENTQDSTSSLNSDRESDARMWSEGYYQNILVEQMLTSLHKEESGGSLQECRVCHRQAPLEERATLKQRSSWRVRQRQL